MGKFRVHLFKLIRVTYLVDAGGVKEAFDGVNSKYPELPIEGEFETDSYDSGVLVDPLLPDGEIDYDNTRWFNCYTGAPMTVEEL